MKPKLQLNSRVMCMNPNSVLFKRIGRVVEFDKWMAWVRYPKPITIPNGHGKRRKVWGVQRDELKVLPNKSVKQQTKLKL